MKIVSFYFYTWLIIAYVFYIMSNFVSPVLEFRLCAFSCDFLEHHMENMYWWMITRSLWFHDLWLFVILALVSCLLWHFVWLHFSPQYFRNKFVCDRCYSANFLGFILPLKHLYTHIRLKDSQNYWNYSLIHSIGFCHIFAQWTNCDKMHCMLSDTLCY